MDKLDEKEEYYYVKEDRLMVVRCGYYGDVVALFMDSDDAKSYASYRNDRLKIIQGDDMGNEKNK